MTSVSLVAWYSQFPLTVCDQCPHYNTVSWAEQVEKRAINIKIDFCLPSFYDWQFSISPVVQDVISGSTAQSGWKYTNSSVVPTNKSFMKTNIILCCTRPKLYFVKYDKKKSCNIGRCYLRYVDICTMSIINWIAIFSALYRAYNDICNAT